MIIEVTNYFAKDGMAPAVAEHRRRASNLRVELGLDPGRILIKLEGDGPDVRWECSFPSIEEYRLDMSKRKASDKFSESRRTMHGLLTRFERHLYTTQE